MDSELQSAAFNMTLVVMPILEAVEVNAPLTEWAPNTDVSTPAASTKAFSHLAMELEITELCGPITAIKSLVSPSLSGSVLLSYSSRVCTGHSLLLPGKDGKKNSAIGLPCRDCLARLAGMKAMPSGLCCFLVLFCWDSLPT